MVFSSAVFLVYFLPPCLTGYHLLPRRWRNVFLLLASVVFYAWGAPRFVAVVLTTTALDFVLVRRLDASRTRVARRAWLVASLALNLGLLAWFKYANFVADNLSALSRAWGGPALAWSMVALPIGISFYTFESLTYVVDVYRRRLPALRRFWHYQLYILLFPKLVAGPIVRYGEVAGQLDERRARETANAFLCGFSRFVLGLCKKVLLANTLGHWAERALLSGLDDLGAPSAWCVLLALTLQLYYDFSGYSDMALGLGGMLGFRLPENFDNPFLARSVTEFWRRWHITLGAWMRDYLYRPLGGNRVGVARQYVNLVLVFLVSGLWHGAGWGFVWFGAWHGFNIVLERVAARRLETRLPAALGMLRTGLVFALGMIFFRDGGRDATLAFFGALARPSGRVVALDAETSVTLALALACAYWNALPFGARVQRRVYADARGPREHALVFGLAASGYVVCLAQIAWSPFNPFIYFRF